MWRSIRRTRRRIGRRRGRRRRRMCLDRWFWMVVKMVVIIMDDYFEMLVLVC